MKQISLSIPRPCHENWEAMTPEDKGRFCGACQKAVVDFTQMTDHQMARFFKKPQGNVCGRFHTDQLERAIALPKKRLPWVKYFFGIALPAFLISLRASGQKIKTGVKPKTTVCNKAMVGFVAIDYRQNLKEDTVKPENLLTGKVSLTKAESLKTFKGHVTNPKGEAVPFASVAAKKEGRMVVADSAGAFAVSYISFPLLLEVSSVGYKPQTILLNSESDSTVILQPAELSLEYVTAGMVVVKSVRKRKSTVPLIEPKNTEAPFSKFSVYPNPVNANGVLTVDVKSIEAGKYNLTIVSGNGNLLQSQTAVVEKEKIKQTITLQNLVAGVYFVRLSNDENGKSFTEKIVVQ